MYVSPAGLLYTSGLLTTNRIFLDFLIVTLLTPVILFSPSLDIAFLAFFSLLLCFALLTGSSWIPAAAYALDWFSPIASSSSGGFSSSLSLSVSECTVTVIRLQN